MTYYLCLACQPHTTLDHDNHGKGPCLIDGCLCVKMQQGNAMAKKPSGRMTYRSNLHAAKRRSTFFPVSPEIDP